MPIIAIDQWKGLWRGGPARLAPLGTCRVLRNLLVDRAGGLRRVPGWLVASGVTIPSHNANTAVSAHFMRLAPNQAIAQELIWVADTTGAVWRLHERSTGSWSQVGTRTGNVNLAGGFADFAPQGGIVVMSVGRYHNNGAILPAAGGLTRYDGTDLFDLGIAAPTTAPTVALGTAQTNQIDSITTGWTVDSGAGAHSATGKDADNSFQILYAAGVTTHDITKNLTPSETNFDTDGTDAIGSNDFLVAWVAIPSSSGGIRQLRSVVIEMGFDAADIDREKILLQAGHGLLSLTTFGRWIRGGDRFEADNFIDLDVDTALTIDRASIQQQIMMNEFSSRTVSNDGETWYPFFFRRRSFFPRGSDVSSRTWSDVEAIRIVVELADDAAPGVARVCYVDDLGWWGGYDVEGFAVYADNDQDRVTPGRDLGGIVVSYTFENDRATQSNPSAESVVMDPVREPIDLSSLELGAASTGIVDRRVFFKIEDLDELARESGAVGDDSSATFSITDPNDGDQVETNNDAPPHAAFCEFHRGIMFLGCLASGANRITWSKDPPDFESFPFVPEELDGIVMGMVSTPAGLIIITDRSVWRVTGRSNADISLSVITEQVGAANHLTIQETPAGIVFLAYDGLYVVTSEGVRKPWPHLDGLFPLNREVTAGEDEMPLRTLPTILSGATYRSAFIRHHNEYMLLYPVLDAVAPGDPPTLVQRTMALIVNIFTGIARIETWNRDMVFERNGNSLLAVPAYAVSTQRPAAVDQERSLTVTENVPRTWAVAWRNDETYYRGLSRETFHDLPINWEVETQDIYADPNAIEEGAWEWFAIEWEPAETVVEAHVLIEGEDEGRPYTSPGERIKGGDSRAFSGQIPIVQSGRYIRINVRGSGELDDLRVIISHGEVG